MMRWFSIGVMAYLTIGIIWWGLLLNRKNQEIFDHKRTSSNPSELAIIEADFRSEKLQIIGEGLFLIISLMGGIFIIYRSANKEIQQVRQQGDFLLSVSHELKSPITAIKLALQTLNRPNLPAATTLKITNSAIKDTDRLEQLVQNILLSTSIEEKKLELYVEPWEVQEIIAQLVSEFESKASKNEIILLNNCTSTVCNLDRTMIRQALVNILQNATKYAIEDSPITITCNTLLNKVQIEISNHGPSIREDEKKLIFQRFYRGQDQAVRSREGTGIGLYISNEIIKAHDGYIEVNSSSKNMTSFTIYLPTNGK